MAEAWSNESPGFPWVVRPVESKKETRLILSKLRCLRFLEWKFLRLDTWKPQSSAMRLFASVSHIFSNSYRSVVMQVSLWHMNLPKILLIRICELQLPKKKMSRDWCFRVTGCYSKLKYMFEKGLEESDWCFVFFLFFGGCPFVDLTFFKCKNLLFKP